MVTQAVILTDFGYSNLIWNICKAATKIITLYRLREEAKQNEKVTMIQQTFIAVLGEKSS